jgi:hypothetical protein
MRWKMPIQEPVGSAKLYWSRDYYRHWVAFTPKHGFVVFPAEQNGWSKRRPVAHDPAKLQEIPADRAFNTGFPAA